MHIMARYICLFSFYIVASSDEKQGPHLSSPASQTRKVSSTPQRDWNLHHWRFSNLFNVGHPWPAWPRTEETPWMLQEPAWASNMDIRSPCTSSSCANFESSVFPIMNLFDTGASRPLNESLQGNNHLNGRKNKQAGKEGSKYSEIPKRS